MVEQIEKFVERIKIDVENILAYKPVDNLEQKIKMYENVEENFRKKYGNLFCLDEFKKYIVQLKSVYDIEPVDVDKQIKKFKYLIGQAKKGIIAGERQEFFDEMIQQLRICEDYINDLILKDSSIKNSSYKKNLEEIFNLRQQLKFIL